jgi:hypothetical protein
MTAVQRALVDGFQQLECRHHGAGWQHFDLQFPASHVVDFFGEIGGVLVEDVLGRPGALKTQCGGSLSGGQHRC